MNSSRRVFLKSLVRDLLVSYENLNGRENLSLDQLGQLPDAELENMVPTCVPGVTLQETADHLVARCNWLNEGLDICPTHSERAWLIQRFDGRTSLRSVAEALVSETGQDGAPAFQRVRDFFLFLAKHGLFAPLHPH